jgi:hypothetical protein
VTLEILPDGRVVAPVDAVLADIIGTLDAGAGRRCAQATMETALIGRRMCG